MSEQAPSSAWLESFENNLSGFFRSERKVLWLSFAICAGLAALHALFCCDIFTDVANYYAEIPREMCKKPWGDALLPTMSPLQPFLAGLLCCLLKFEPYSAAIAASGLFYALTVFPLYFMLKAFLEPKHAAWGCLLYALAPKIVRFGCTGLIDSGRNFFIVSIIAIALSDWSKRSWLKAIASGCCCAFLVMSRGEGAVFLPLCFGFLAIAAFKGALAGSSISKAALASFLALAAAGAAMLATLSPRLIQVHAQTGYYIPDYRLLNDLRDRVPALSFGAPDIPMKPPRQINLGSDATAKAATPEDGKRRKLSLGQKLGKLAGDSFRGSYELYLILAAFGLAVAIKERRLKWAYCVPLLFLLLNEAVFASISIAYRYFIVNIILLMPLTAIGFVKTLELLERFKLKRAIAPALALIAIMQIINGLAMLPPFSDSGYEKAVGDWIKEHKNELKSPSANDVVLLTSHSPYAFWADSRFFFIRKDAKELPNIDFDVAVLDARQKPLIGALRARADFVEAASWEKEGVLIFKKRRAEGAL